MEKKSGCHSQANTVTTMISLKMLYTGKHPNNHEFWFFVENYLLMSKEVNVCVNSELIWGVFLMAMFCAHSRSVSHSGMQDIFSFWDKLFTKGAVAHELQRQHGEYDSTTNGEWSVSHFVNVLPESDIFHFASFCKNFVKSEDVKMMLQLGLHAKFLLGFKDADILSLVQSGESNTSRVQGH